jgi:hypothetical protein
VRFVFCGAKVVGFSVTTKFGKIFLQILFTNKTLKRERFTDKAINH